MVHAETAPGIVTVAAASMLDPVACAGMETGAPCAGVSALADLRRLLTAPGFRTDCPDSLNVAQGSNGEARATGPAARTPTRDGVGRQEAMEDDAARARRGAAGGGLARLLLAADALPKAARNDSG